MEIEDGRAVLVTPPAVADYMGVDMSKGTCEVEGCSRPILARVWCSRHYHRWKRHGDPTAVVQQFVQWRHEETAAGPRLIITTTKGLEHVVLYDPADADLVAAHRWYISPRGYVTSPLTNPKGTLYLARLILGLGAGDERVGDHINGDRLDNRRHNLRIVTNQANVQHQAVINAVGTSRYRGVQWKTDRHKWRGGVKIDGRTRHVGYFATEEAAAAAVAAFRAEHGLPPGY